MIEKTISTSFPSGEEKSIGLTSLRKITFVLFKDFIFDVLLFGPKQKDFITYRWFCSISQTLGQGNSFCIDELPFRIQSRTMAGQFSAHLWTSILAGFILAFPYIIFEFWKFISPGLYEKERKNARGFIFIASMLFFIGVLFGYYIVTPLSINFLGNYSVSREIFNDFEIFNATSSPGINLFFSIEIMDCLLTPTIEASSFCVIFAPFL